MLSVGRFEDSVLVTVNYLLWKYSLVFVSGGFSRILP